MKTAIETRQYANEVKHRIISEAEEEIEKILTDISNDIDEAVLKGKFNVLFTYEQYTNSHVINEISEKLTGLGYSVKLYSYNFCLNQYLIPHSMVI